MKTKPSSVASLGYSRHGAIMDTFVVMLIATLLPAWIAGTLYLSIFAAATSDPSSTELSDSQLTADTELSSDTTTSTDNAGTSNADSSNANDFEISPRQPRVAESLSNDRIASLEEATNELKKRLRNKSQELDQVRQQLTANSERASNSSADTAGLQNQIAQLAQQRDQFAAKSAQFEHKVEQLQQDALISQTMSAELSELTAERDRLKLQLTTIGDSATAIAQRDQLITALNEQTASQKQEILTLQDQAIAARAAQRDAEKMLAGVAASPPPLVLAPVPNAVPATSPSLVAPLATGSNGFNRQLEYRDWTSSRGNKARLAFVRWENNLVVVVNEENKEFQVPLHRLSPIDQDYVNGKR